MSNLPDSSRPMTSELLAKKGKVPGFGDLPKNVLIEAWLADCCDTKPRGCYSYHWTRELSSKLFASWRGWTEGLGLMSGSNTMFSRELVALGYVKKRGTPGHQFLGIKLKSSPPAKLKKKNRHFVTFVLDDEGRPTGRLADDQPSLLGQRLLEEQRNRDAEFGAKVKQDCSVFAMQHRHLADFIADHCDAGPAEDRWRLYGAWCSHMTQTIHQDPGAIRPFLESMRLLGFPSEGGKVKGLTLKSGVAVAVLDRAGSHRKVARRLRKQIATGEAA